LTSSGTSASASTGTLASTSSEAAKAALAECAAPMVTALASERHSWLAAIDSELLELLNHCGQNHDIAELGVGNLLEDAHRRIAGRLATLQEATRADNGSDQPVEPENIVDLTGANRAEEPEGHVAEGQGDLRLARQRQAFELLDQGMTKMEIARRFSISLRSLSRLLATARPSNSTEPSTQSARAGGRDATKKQIAKLAKQGLSQRAIAGRLGVSRDMVYRLLKKVKGVKGRPRDRRVRRKATSINQRAA
jgi:transposase